MVVVGGIYEDEVVIVMVEVVEVVMVDGGEFEFGVSIEGVVDDFVVYDVFCFGVYECIFFVGFDVLEFDDCLELFVDVENGVVFDVVGI